MLIYDDVSKIKKDGNTVLTLGTFDGIHLGHRKIIDEVLRKSELYGGRSFLITFHPHPRTVISKKFDLKLLTTNAEKVELLGAIGIENLLIINFTEKFSRLSPGEFIKTYLIDSIGLKEIVVGYNHQFGKGRGGDVNTLRTMGRQNNFNVTSVDAYVLENQTVSSTTIRNALTEGNLKLANEFLGRYYSFSGKVIRGDGRGRELGYPTANIALDDPQKLLPALGIYLVECSFRNENHFGLLSIGKRPTFYTSGDVVPEVYLYNFEGNIYGVKIKVSLIERIRGEIKFNSARELIEQMDQDKETGLEILSKLNN